MLSSAVHCPFAAPFFLSDACTARFQAVEGVEAERRRRDAVEDCWVCRTSRQGGD